MATDRRVPASTYLLGGLLVVGMVLPILMFAGDSARHAPHGSVGLGPPTVRDLPEAPCFEPDFHLLNVRISEDVLLAADPVDALRSAELESRYGAPLSGGPTGRTRTIEGITFVQLSPGFCHVRRHIWSRAPAPGPERIRSKEWLDLWLEQKEPVWIGKTHIDTLNDLGLTHGYQPDSWSDLCGWMSSRTFGGVRRPTEEEMLYVVAVGLAPESPWLVGYVGGRGFSVCRRDWMLWDGRPVRVGIEWQSFEGSDFEVLERDLEHVQEMFEGLLDDKADASSPPRPKAADPMGIRFLVWVPEGDDLDDR